MANYTGRVVSASFCPYWTSVVEEKMPHLAELNKTQHLTLQGMSLIVLLDTPSGLQYCEVYIYGTCLIKNDEITYVEVIQTNNGELETIELSLAEELSEISIQVEELSFKMMKNGTIRNMRGRKNDPLLKCRYARLNKAWLPSEVEGEVEDVAPIKEMPSLQPSEVNALAVA